MIYEVKPDPNEDHALSDQETWGTDDRCTGTDAPAASNVRPWPCPAAAEPESRDEAAELLYRLAVAALALASSQLEIRSGSERFAVCATCGETASAGSAFHHRPRCLSAEIIETVTRLRQVGSLDPNSYRREDVSTEGASAGDGNRSRLAFHEPWHFYAGPEPGTFYVADQDGCDRAVVSGRFVERLAIAERIVSCVNFCRGNSTELLGKLKAAAEGEE